MRQNKRVCFQVDEVNNDKDWKSVMVLGEYQEVHDEREYNDAMKAFDDRRFFLKISKPVILPGSNEQAVKIQLKGNNKPAIFRIVIDEKSGRFENE